MNIALQLYCERHGGRADEEACIRCTRTERDKLLEENKALRSEIAAMTADYGRLKHPEPNAKISGGIPYAEADC